MADDHCGMAQAMGVLGDAWTALILRDVARGAHRFDQLVAESGISRKVLAARLRALEEAEVLARVAYQVRPVASDYRLTERGRAAAAGAGRAAGMGRHLAARRRYAERHRHAHPAQRPSEWPPWSAPGATAPPDPLPARPGVVHGPLLLPRHRAGGHRRRARRSRLHPRVVHLPRPARRLCRAGRARGRRQHPAARRAGGVRGGQPDPVPAGLRRRPRADDRAAAADVPARGRHPAQAPHLVVDASEWCAGRCSRSATSPAAWTTRWRWCAQSSERCMTCRPTEPVRG